MKAVTTPIHGHNRDIQYFKYQRRGHIASQCPNQRSIMMQANENIVSNDKDEYTDMPPLTGGDEETNKEIPTNDHVRFVARRASTTHVMENEIQMENIYHTRCHIKDKVRSLIIDAGSCASVARLLMVEKLALSTMDHPRP